MLLCRSLAALNYSGNINYLNNSEEKKYSVTRSYLLIPFLTSLHPSLDSLLPPQLHRLQAHHIVTDLCSLFPSYTTWQKLTLGKPCVCPGQLDVLGGKHKDAGRFHTKCPTTNPSVSSSGWASPSWRHVLTISHFLSLNPSPGDTWLWLHLRITWKPLKHTNAQVPPAQNLF